ncbi:hypothetical protein AAVH_08616 [Aphelenchoides avenae]|nr:hypothetical protein AAVH_08616 [Aphelenchus avenae]
MLIHQLLFLSVLCYSQGSCPKFDEWRTATTSVNGPLVCAKLYNNENCTGFPILFGVNISVGDLSHTLTVMPLKTSHVSALVRPGCTMHLWKNVNYTGTHSSSTSYSWKIMNPDFMSALCNCSTE